eukprot:SAG31_NODE_2503_length_5594_cov_1.758326_1_plen_292_part_10
MSLRRPELQNGGTRSIRNHRELGIENLSPGTTSRVQNRDTRSIRNHREVGIPNLSILRDIGVPNLSILRDIAPHADLVLQQQLVVLLGAQVQPEAAHILVVLAGDVPGPLVIPLPVFIEQVELDAAPRVHLQDFSRDFQDIFQDISRFFKISLLPARAPPPSRASAAHRHGGGCQGSAPSRVFVSVCAGGGGGGMGGQSGGGSAGAIGRADWANAAPKPTHPRERGVGCCCFFCSCSCFSTAGGGWLGRGSAGGGGAAREAESPRCAAAAFAAAPLSEDAEGRRRRRGGAAA